MRSKFNCSCAAQRQNKSSDDSTIIGKTLHITVKILLLVNLPLVVPTTSSFALTEWTDGPSIHWPYPSFSTRQVFATIWGSGELYLFYSTTRDYCIISSHSSCHSTHWSWLGCTDRRLIRDEMSENSGQRIQLLCFFFDRSNFVYVEQDGLYR